MVRRLFRGHLPRLAALGRLDGHVLSRAAQPVSRLERLRHVGIADDGAEGTGKITKRVSRCGQYLASDR